MGAVEETRKPVQDFLVPELREIEVRIGALEGITKPRFEAQEEANKARFEEVKVGFDVQEGLAATRHETVLLALNTLTNYNALAERLSKLEHERKPEAQH